MQHYIFTNNFPLRTGIYSALKDAALSHRYCFIDLDSCNRLQDIMNALASAEQRCNDRVVFLGGKSIYTDLLTPLKPVDRCENMNVFHSMLTRSAGVTISCAKKFINACLSLKMLASREVRICKLSVILKVNKVAEMENLSGKSIYRIDNNAAKTLCFRSQLRFHTFLSREFMYEFTQLLRSDDITQHVTTQLMPFTRFQEQEVHCPV
ncbi:hypothetical protein [Enterobacter chuandaensis]|uniref:Uncharacterized protein n=1 Tax=Enterobacter chuandaensis TaxID=2497875 RepID=A0AA96M3B4_9ENTR|nr:hypothetical protein [Enterobacter chuandaensis]MCW4783060.1 hypothetical protein [Enterobacter chuandaensis]MDA4760263.1 hypothetical protein [Enterobacter chuandaensis]WNS37169.1 hypothetical protein RQP59_19180 [Enterobacter chuandaensis]